MLETKYKGYFVDDKGNVYSNKSGELKQMRTQISKYGYVRVKLFVERGKSRVFFVHRLVYETYVADVPKGMQIDHINGVKTDNNLSNLELVTPSENRQRCCDMKLQNFKKLVDDDTLVKMILEAVECGNKDKVSRKYGLGRNFLSQVFLKQGRKDIWEREELKHIDPSMKFTRPRTIDDDTLVKMILEVDDGAIREHVSLKYGRHKNYIGQVLNGKSRQYIWDDPRLAHIAHKYKTRV